MVELEILLSNFVPGEILGVGVGGFAHFFEFLGLGEEGLEGLGGGLDISFGDEEAGFSWDNGFGSAAGATGDDRTAAALGFEEDLAETLEFLVAF